MVGFAPVPRIIKKSRVQLTHTKKKRLCDVQIHNSQPQARGNQEVFPGSGYLSGCWAHWKYFTCNAGRKMCGYSFVCMFDLSVLLKIMACMRESILVYKKTKTRPSHPEKSLCSFTWALYALKWMDEVNNHYLGRPSHLTNYMRVNLIQL